VVECGIPGYSDDVEVGCKEWWGVSQDRRRGLAEGPQAKQAGGSDGDPLVVCSVCLGFGGRERLLMSLPNALLLLLLLPGLKECLVVQVGSKDTTTMPVKIRGTQWSIRITMTLSDDEERQLNDISGAVIVYHAGGTRAGGFNEKPHYHCYLQYDGERNDVSRIFLANPIVSKYHKPSNAFWMIDTKPIYTLESFWHYVWAGFPLKRQRLIHWGDPRPQMPVPESPLVVGAPEGQSSQESVPVVLRPKQAAKKTSLDKQQKFLQYCRDYYEGEDTNNATPKEILGLLYDYCRQNGHTTESCCFTYVNYVISNLHTGDEYEESKRRWSRRLLDKFF